MKTDIEKLINFFISFIVFISIFSLICMFLRQSIISMDSIPTINSGTYGTKALFFTNIKIGSGNLYFLRNQGPFWEPGAYQAYLNVALLFLLFSGIERKHRYFEIIVLCITILSTISTTGYLVLGLLILAKMFQNDHSSIRSKLFIIALLAIIVTIAINNETVNYLLFDKMNSSSENHISNATRLYSVIQNCRGIIQNPLFGIAPSKYSTLFTESISFFGAVSFGVNTTTSLSVWALYGVVYFVFFNGGLFLFSKSMGKDIFFTILLLLAIAVIYNTENLNYSVFFNLLPIWGYYRSGGVLFENSRNYNSI